MLAWLIKHDWLGHIIEMVCISAVVALLSYFFLGLSASVVCGVFFGVGHFHGREKRDCEVKLKMKPPHLKAYWFGLWNKDQLTDFFPVAGVGVLLVWAVIVFLLSGNPTGLF